MPRIYLATAMTLILLGVGSLSQADSQEFNSLDPNLAHFRAENIAEPSGQFCLNCEIDKAKLDPKTPSPRDTFLGNLIELREQILAPR